MCRQSSALKSSRDDGNLLDVALGMKGVLNGAVIDRMADLLPVAASCDKNAVASASVALGTSLDGLTGVVTRLVVTHGAAVHAVSRFLLRQQTVVGVSLQKRSRCHTPVQASLPSCMLAATNMPSPVSPS